MKRFGIFVFEMEIIA